MTWTRARKAALSLFNRFPNRAFKLIKNEKLTTKNFACLSLLIGTAYNSYP